MSNPAYRSLRVAIVACAAALVALTMVVPASAESSDDQAPSAPTRLTSTYFSDRLVTRIDWNASSDDIDAPEELIYIVETDDPYAPRQVIRGGVTETVATFPFTVTVWAVDTSGNASEKVTVRTTTV